MKNILLLTPIYPSPDNAQKSTPVVHYFAKEWVKSGNKVMVCHYPANFPALFRLIAKPFRSILESYFNDAITTQYISNCKFEYDGVHVCRIPFRKIIPHKRYSANQIKKVVNQTIGYCDSSGFKPDVIIGHWVNPQVDIINLLKPYFKVPVCLVLHGSGSDIRTLYKEKTEEILKSIDAFGFRSAALKRRFEHQYGVVSKAFYCYSGVPSKFLEGISNDRSFENVKSFIYVGMMIKRKFPFETLLALAASKIDDFSIKYIGQGSESSKIEMYLQELSNNKPNSRVELLGQIPRDEIKQHLMGADVFIMMSKNEVFGLVYLEAMATGCIPIAAKNEGFDGIIVDGYNGFLCEAGNINELTEIINKINSMPADSLRLISQHAMSTARNMTDSKVAEKYLSDVCELCNI